MTRPALRDRLAAAQHAPPFDHFFVPFTTTLSLNWPYEPRDCLILNPAYNAARDAAPNAGPVPPVLPADGLSADPEDYPSRWIINPVFESHLRNLGNYSLGPAFRDAFPDFADAVRVNEESV